MASALASIKSVPTSHERFNLCSHDSTQAQIGGVCFKSHRKRACAGHSKVLLHATCRTTCARGVKHHCRHTESPISRRVQIVRLAQGTQRRARTSSTSSRARLLSFPHATRFPVVRYILGGYEYRMQDSSGIRKAIRHWESFRSSPPFRFGSVHYIIISTCGHRSSVASLRKLR